MAAQLGQTSDPVALIPGDPGAVAGVAGQLYNYGMLLTEAGNGLQRIDTSSGWQGAAADAFRSRFTGQPAAWLTAGSCFTAAAKALDAYVPVLSWAQQEAAAAIGQWNAGDKQGAQATLGHARSRVSSAAGTATNTIGQARDKAPQKPGFWSHVGGFFDDVWHSAEHGGADVLNGVASFGNAMAAHPLDDLGMLAGTVLAGLSATADAGGLALDATGVGAIVGVPVNALATAGVLAGGTMAMASAGDLARNAAGDDRVDPVSVGDGGGPALSDPRLTPGTPEYDEYIADLAKDPAKSGRTSPASVREATVATQAEADGDIPGPIARTPFDDAGNDQGDFTDGTGQRWEVKSSPDVRPSYKGDTAGQPIANPQNNQEFTDMINDELDDGQNVLLDPDGMTPTRLADLQHFVADHPEWQGRVTWGR